MKICPFDKKDCTRNRLCQYGIGTEGIDRTIWTCPRHPYLNGGKKDV